MTASGMQAALEAALGAQVTSLDVRPSAYATSFALDEVDAVLADGTRLALMAKRVGDRGLAAAARDAKPAFLRDPEREIAVYRDVLAPAGLGTPRYYGHHDGVLFIERVAGVELYQVGARATWEHVARWLGRAHAALASAADRAPSAIRYDRAWYARWAERAVRFAHDRGDDGATRTLAGVVAGYDAVIDRLAALPATLLHGELYASNVLVDDPEAPDRVTAVDWEQAAVGPGPVDLAALTSGRWDDAARAAIAAAYADTAPVPLDEGALAACRLHLALQWLGWSAQWSPPAEHRTDWLAEAVRAREALGRVA